MKTADKSARIHKERGQEINGQDKALQIPVITQNMPDDTFDSAGPITAAKGDSTPTQRELEQDVTMTNPSVESMDGRG